MIFRILSCFSKDSSTEIPPEIVLWISAGIPLGMMQVKISKTNKTNKTSKRGKIGFLKPVSTWVCANDLKISPFSKYTSDSNIFVFHSTITLFVQCWEVCIIFLWTTTFFFINFSGDFCDQTQLPLLFTYWNNWSVE